MPKLTVCCLPFPESSPEFSSEPKGTQGNWTGHQLTPPGYGLFIKETTDYPGNGASSGWARIPAIRHAMSTYKYTETFWYLDQDAIIMNPSLSLESHIFAELPNLIRRDIPVVPPDSIIRTYRHVPAEKVQMILSQDKTGLQVGSIILKAGTWAQYFLDAWYDPMFRFYNFQKGEQNALVSLCVLKLFSPLNCSRGGIGGIGGEDTKK